MTVIYNSYYPAIESGEIDLNKVDFSVLVVGKDYEPKPEDTITEVVDVIETFDDVLVEKDIATLTMGEIIDKAAQQVQEESKRTAHGFVVFDTRTEKLCFYENFETQLWQQDIG